MKQAGLPRTLFQNLLNKKIRRTNLLCSGFFVYSFCGTFSPNVVLHGEVFEVMVEFLLLAALGVAQILVHVHTIVGDFQETSGNVGAVVGCTPHIGQDVRPNKTGFNAAGTLLHSGVSRKCIRFREKT